MAQSAANVNVALNLDSASFQSSAEKARKVMTDTLAAIRSESVRTGDALGGITKSTQGFATANDNVKRFGNIAQQAGFQVGDFAVQIAGGTSGLTAFIQQGSQIAGAFGPVGAVIGAVGAVLGVFAKTLLDSGTNAEDAQTQLDKLTKSTDAYREALERVQPLEIARLQNIIDYKTAAEAAAAVRFAPEAVLGRQPGGNAAQNPFAPGAGMLPGGLNPFTGQPIQQEIQQGKEAINRFEQMTAEYLDAQYRARQRIEKAQQEIRDRNKPGIIAKAEFKPGLEERPYHQEEQRAAQAAATAAKTAAAAAKVTEDALKRRAEAAAKVIQQADFEAASAERLAEANDQSAEAYKRASIEVEREQTILQKSVGLNEEQVAILRELVEAEAAAKQRILETNQAREEENKLVAANIAFMDRIAKDAEKLKADAAKEQAEIYAQPFKDLATNISRTLSTGIQDALSGDFDFATFAEGFSDIFADTLAASITAALTPALTSAAKSFGDVVTKSFAGGIAGGPLGAGLTPGGAALGGAALGGIGGGLFGQYGPGMKPGNFAGIGGAIGGAGGAGLGAWLMPANPLLGAGIGGLAGGLLGSLTGGLFGGQNNLGNDRSAQAYRSGRGITYSDTSFSQENRDITAGILSEIAVLEEAFTDLGGVVGDVKLRIEAGNKSGITVDGRKFATAEDALAASISKLIGGTSGLTVSQQTVLANTKGGSAAEIGADLEVAAQFDALTFKGSELTRQLVALDAEMAAFGKTAQALGLDINAVAAAHEEERKAIIDAQAAEQNAIRAAIENLSPSGNTLDIALAQLNDQVQELAKAATAAEVPLEGLAATHQRAANQLIAANAQLQQSLALQVSALDPATDQLSLALAQLNQQVQELASQITASGGSLDALAGAHQRAAADIVNQFQEQQRLQRQQAQDEQRRLQAQIKAQQEQARAEAAARKAQITDFQARVTLLEADPLSAIVIGIQENIRQIIAQGKELGLTAGNEAKIRAAGARLEAAARKEFTDSLNEQIRNYQTQVYLLEASPLDAALAQIRERFNELIDQGKKIGLTPQSEADIRAIQGRAETTARNRAKLDQDAFILQLRGMGAAQNDAALLTAELALQFKELTIQATELNIPLSEVTAAQARATQALQERLALDRTQVEDQIARVGGSDTLADRLRQLDVEMRELARAAAGVGIPLSAVTAAHIKAAQRIRDEWAEMLADMLRQQRDATQGILEAQRGAAGAIDQFLNPFKEALSSRGIGQGVYGGAVLAQSGLKEFREALAKARTGDTGALSSLVGIGQGAIAQARQTFGSTKAFADIFREIEAGFREQQGVLEQKREELLSQIGTFTRETVNEIIKLRVQAIGDLRADLAKLSRDIVVAVEGNA